MKSWIIVAALAISVGTLRAQQTYPSPTCNETDVENTYTTEQSSPKDGDIILVPAGTCTWTTTWNLVTPTNSLTIQGAGAVSATTGGAATTGSDNTVIIDNVNHAAGGFPPTWQVTTTSGKSFRISGIAFIQNSSSSLPTHGIIEVLGSSSAIRIDHCHFYNNEGQEDVFLDGDMTGVADHDFFDAVTNIVTDDIAFYNGQGWNGDTGDVNGDGAWTDSDHFGTSEFFFAEDDYFHDGGATDCLWGGRFVLRYSTGLDTPIYSHGLNIGTERGCRAAEVYGNNFTYQSTYVNYPFGALLPVNSGAAIAWGNTVVGFKSVVTTSMERTVPGKANDTAHLSSVPGSFGYCGPAPYTTGTASTTASSTSVTGTGFSTSWAANTFIIIPGASCTVTGTTGDSCEIASVQSSTALTLASAAGATVSNVTYSAGSPWDANANSIGYACLDAPARGKGDLISGSSFPGIVDASVTSAITSWSRTSNVVMLNFSSWVPATPATVGFPILISGAATGSGLTSINGSFTICGVGTTGCSNPTGTSLTFTQTAANDSSATAQGTIASITYPHQALTPIYVFDNTYTAPGTGQDAIARDVSATLADNRDFYQQVGTKGETGSNCTGSPCNITVGVNQSSRAPVNGTDSCTAGRDPVTGGTVAGVGWWDTQNNTLYACTATNVWSAYYTPYAYPNPLAVTGGSSMGGIGASSTCAGGMPAPCAPTDRVPRPNLGAFPGPNVDGTWSDSGPQIGQVWINSFGHREVRVTDGLIPGTSSFGGDGWSGPVTWWFNYFSIYDPTLDGTGGYYFYVPLDNGQGDTLFTLNAKTMQIGYQIPANYFGTFSYVTPALMYYATGSQLCSWNYDTGSGSGTCSDTHGTKVYDFATCPGLSGITGLGDVVGATDDQTFSERNSNVLAVYSVRYNRCYWVNVSTDQIGGTDNPTPVSVTPPSWPGGYGYHDGNINASGQYAFMVPGNGGPVVDIWQVYNGTGTETTTINGCTATSGACGGHIVLGNSKLVYVAANPATGGAVAGHYDFASTPLSAPSTETDIVPAPQYPGYDPFNSNRCNVEDTHDSWQAVNAGDNMPFVFSSFTDVANSWPLMSIKCAWDHEIDVMAADGSAQVWRLAHNRATTQNNPLAAVGSSYNADSMPVCSADGRFCLWATDWQASLGTQTGEISGGTYCQGANGCQWTASTAYAVHQEVIDSNGNEEMATVAGTSGAGSHPTWPTTIGGTVGDGGVTWQMGAGCNSAQTTATAGLCRTDVFIVEAGGNR